MVSFQFARTSLACLALISSVALPVAHGAWVASAGYSSSELYSTRGTFTLIEALDVAGPHAYLGAGTSVFSLSLTQQTVGAVGTLPPNVSVNFVKRSGTNTFAAYSVNYVYPYPSRFGKLEGAGGFEDLGGYDSIYDADVDASGTLYFMANPGDAGTKVFRFDAVSNVIQQVLTVGGYSGGLAFDRFDRLHVADLVQGQILRYTPAQLAQANLTTMDGIPVITNLWSKYVCFDPYQRLYVVSGYGNVLTMHDGETGELLDTIAVDSQNAYGIGRIDWDHASRRLVAIYTDYGPYYSAVHAVSVDGIAGNASIFRSWVADYAALTPSSTPDSGGMARDQDLNVVVADPSPAILGKPADFSGGDISNPSGHFISLGNGGSITLMFEDAIVNGPGPDFAVFENGFVDQFRTSEVEMVFAELAFVEVATTTNAWVRFPVVYPLTNVIYNLDNLTNQYFASQNTALIQGLAEKYTTSYGTPFDLARLAGHPSVTNGSVDLDNIQYVRITDVVGDGTTTDDDGRPIYDPYFDALNGYPAAAPASMLDGFDLRGVGVIHSAGLKPVAGTNDLPAVRMAVQPGRVYQLQYSQNGVTWHEVGPLISGTGGVQRLDLPSNLGAAMFRVSQIIPEAP